MIATARLGSNDLTRIALAFLASGGLLHLFVRPASPFALGVVDGAWGACLGIAIGCVAWAGVKRRRGR